jgi:hypothetical protein
MKTRGAHCCRVERVPFMPQLQNQWSSLRGDQLHCGQRMCGGPDVPSFFSSSSSRSKTTNDLATSFKRVQPPLGEQPILSQGFLESDRRRTPERKQAYCNFGVDVFGGRVTRRGKRKNSPEEGREKK